MGKGSQEAPRAVGRAPSPPSAVFLPLPSPCLPEGPPDVRVPPLGSESLSGEQSKKPVPATFLSGGGGRGRGCDFLELPSPSRPPPRLGPAGACWGLLGPGWRNGSEDRTGGGQGPASWGGGRALHSHLELSSVELSGESLISNIELSRGFYKGKDVCYLTAWWGQMTSNGPSSTLTV